MPDRTEAGESRPHSHTGGDSECFLLCPAWTPSIGQSDPDDRHPVARELLDTRKLLKAALLLCGYSDEDAAHYLTVYLEDIEAEVRAAIEAEAAGSLSTSAHGGPLDVERLALALSESAWNDQVSRPAAIWGYYVWAERIIERYRLASFPQDQSDHTAATVEWVASQKWDGPVDQSGERE